MESNGVTIQNEGTIVCILVEEGTEEMLGFEAGNEAGKKRVFVKQM